MQINSDIVYGIAHIQGCQIADAMRGEAHLILEMDLQKRARRPHSNPANAGLMQRSFSVVLHEQESAALLQHVSSYEHRSRLLVILQ